MKAPRSLRYLAAIFAFAGATLAASAQIITYFETISDYTGSNISFANGRALTQTFTNVLQIQSMTYRFVRSTGTSATSLSYYFVEWDSLTNKATNLLSSGSLSVPGIGSFTSYNYTDPDTLDTNSYLGYDYVFNLNYTTAVATKTYAMVLVGSTGSSNLSLQLIDTNPNKFPYGAAYRTDGVSSFANLGSTAGSGYAPLGTDWGFAQIAVELAPIPEPATAAAGVGAVLVLGLVILRQYRRRQEEAALALVPIKS